MLSAGALLDAAVRKNAEWCHAMCRAHGLPSRFGSAVWSCAVRTPPSYPDAMTLRSSATAEQLLEGIDTGPGCSVKDSFAAVDLTRAGFRILFEAEWIGLPAPSPGPGAQWDAVGDSRGLADWERALDDDGDARGLFRSALLDRPDVEFLAARQDGRIVAGALLNRSPTVVGVSNLFSVTEDLGRAWSGAIGTAAARHPGLPIVGYEHGAYLAAAVRQGFGTIGPLRVWLRGD